MAASLLLERCKGHPWSFRPGGQPTCGEFSACGKFHSSSSLCWGEWGPRQRQDQWLAQDHSVKAEIEIILCGRRWGEVSDPVFIKKKNKKNKTEQTSVSHICCFCLKVLVAQSCPASWDPPRSGGPVAHQAPLSMGILQARILEWVAMPSSRVPSQPMDQSAVSCTAGGFFTSWATREACCFCLRTCNFRMT